MKRWRTRNGARWRRSIRQQAGPFMRHPVTVQVLAVLLLLAVSLLIARRYIGWDQLTEEDENDVIRVLVWSLVGSVAIQCLVHYSTFAVLIRQRDQTDVGRALKVQMFWLGTKNVFMIGFHTILALLVTTGVYHLTTAERISLYVAIIVTTYLAVISGVNLVWRLVRENLALRREVDALRREALGEPAP